MKRKIPCHKLVTHELKIPVGIRRIDEYIKEPELEIEIDINDEVTDEEWQQYSEVFEQDVLYEGVGMVLVSLSPDHVVPQEIRFPIEADSLQDAWDKFDDSASARLEEIEEESKKPRIHTPSDYGLPSTGPTPIIK